jgi:peptide-methionine (R)-S-oxide reductase
MENKTSPQTKETVGQTVEQVRQSSRRTFLTVAVTASGGAALWSLRKPSASAAAAERSVDAPSIVTVVKFSSSGANLGKETVPHIVKPDAEWKRQLSAISYEVARQAGKERPYTGDSWDLHTAGLFRCVCCDTALFNSATKFDSGTGWPSFWQVLAKENVVEIRDTDFGMVRTAISCRRCDAHIGHVFDDGPQPTGSRYCMNSVAMHFAKFA